MSTPSSSTRSRLANLLLVLASFAVAALAGEAVVRIFLKDETALFPRYHTDYRYGKYALRGIRPDSTFRHTSADGAWTFATNSRGFRSERNYPYEKPAGTLRVLALGDSHTQGYEVRQEATYAAALERWLARRGRRAEVLNAGVSGFSTAEELAFLENEGHRYAPDVVVVGFYANDFADNVKAGLFALDAQGALVERSYEHLPGVRIQNLIYAAPGVKWLSESSYFYNLLFNNVWAFFKERLRRGAFEYAVASSADSSAQQVGLAAALLERMQRFCEARGMRLIVLDIPERPAPHAFASSIPPALRALLAAKGIEVLAAEEVLGGLDGAAEFHLPRGHQHISELTHALIGAKLGARILGR